MSARFYYQDRLEPHSVIKISQNTLAHLRALRLRPQDKLIVFDGDGGEYEALYLGKNEIHVLEHHDIEREYSVPIIVAHALCATERTDWSIQKSVEMGATQYIPLYSQHSQHFPEGVRGQKRLQRWHSIIQSASEQCGRNTLMRISLPMSFNDLFQSKLPEEKYIFDAKGEPLLPSLPKPSLILIGPEGGWHENERKIATHYNTHMKSLGPSILRSETAVVTALARLTMGW
jgi:16S rRNA (uracil1498-N3)-methyltransferase